VATIARRRGAQVADKARIVVGAMSPVAPEAVTAVRSHRRGALRPPLASGAGVFALKSSPRAHPSARRAGVPRHVLVADAAQ
jgi:hypothetical protein